MKIVIGDKIYKDIRYVFGGMGVIFICNGWRCG